MNEKFPTLHIVNHPLVQHKLTVMRDKNTSVKDFRTLVGEVAMLLTYEATRDLPTTLKTIETPLCTCEIPMLATGGSADMAITKMKELGCKNIKLMILVAAPEGVQFIYDRHPDVEIYCAALDDHLNENGYIVPGLGDAGDRIFGTK